MGRWLWTFAVAVFGWAVSTTTHAQPVRDVAGPTREQAEIPDATADETKSAAEDQFNVGLSLQKVDDFEGAIVAYRASVRLYPTKSALFNLANCLRATHRYPEALEALERLEADHGAELTEPMKSAAARQLHELRALTATLKVVVADGETPLEGASISIDGVEVAKSPMPAPVRVKLGEHTVDVRLEGYQPTQKRLTLLSGQQSVESIQMLPEHAPAAPPPSPPQDSSAEPKAQPVGTPPSPSTAEASDRSLTRAGWALAGSGALLLVGGAVTGSWALSLDSDLNDTCTNGSCPSSRRTDIERMENMALATDILLGVGLVATALGVTLILSDDEASSESPAAALHLTPGFVRATGSF